VREAIPEASERRICEVLDVSRSACQPGKKRKSGNLRIVPAVNPELSERIRELIQVHPTYGYRRIWALLRHQVRIVVNRKAVYRILKLKRWFVHNRAKTPKPRVQGSRSITEKSNVRWAIDITHIPCGKDGWGHLVALVDCHDRSCIGYEFALRGRAKEAERALGRSLPEPFRDLEERTGQAGDPQRQRPYVPKREIPGNVSRLRIAPGIRDALYAGTERHDRKIFQEPEGRMRLVEEFSFLRGCQARNRWLDSLVQRGKAPSISGISFPEAVSAKTSGISGLISGEHYNHAIPYSLWHNNDLWNLFPAASSTNRNKSDRLPTRRLLEHRRETIQETWEAVSLRWPARFFHEAKVFGETLETRTRSWPDRLFRSFCEAMEITALQRGVERWEPEKDWCA
jgi:hypothetical protein